jgi:hypothetical protein
VTHKTYFHFAQISSPTNLMLLILIFRAPVVIICTTRFILYTEWIYGFRFILRGNTSWCLSYGMLRRVETDLRFRGGYCLHRRAI